MSDSRQYPVPEMPGGGSINAKSASIIIPTFNGASRIGNCLDSLVKQTAGAGAYSDLRSGCATFGCACVGACARRFFADNAALHAAGNQERSDRRNTLTYPARRSGVCAGTGRCRWPDVCPPQACRENGQFQANSGLRKLRRPFATPRGHPRLSTPINRRLSSVALRDMRVI